MAFWSTGLELTNGELGLHLQWSGGPGEPSEQQKAQSSTNRCYLDFVNTCVEKCDGDAGEKGGTWSTGPNYSRY